MKTSVARLQNFAHQCYLKRIPLLPQIIGRYMRYVYGCDIPYTAEIHPSVMFAHKGLGVVMGHNAVIGENVKILNNVTIGGRGGRKAEDGRSNPKIGNNVLIGAGACLLGPIEIAAGVSIGANAVVLESVLQEGVTVVGIPAEIVGKRRAKIDA